MRAALHITAERCAHQRLLRSHCEACVQSCPRQAWAMGTEGLTFDDAACAACGLCVAQCPTEALSLPAPVALLGPAPRISLQGKRENGLWLACEVAAPAWRGEGVTPCLHALAPHTLMAMTEQRHARVWHLSCGDCTECPRQPPTGDSLWSRWADLASRLAQQGVATPGLQRWAPERWREQARPLQAPDASRRGFLRRLSQPAPTAATPSFTSERAATAERLRQAGAVPSWNLQLDATRCTACMACTRICPHDALVLEPTTPGRANWHWRLDRCTGCGLCVDVCDDHALTLAATRMPEPTAATAGRHPDAAAIKPEHRPIASQSSSPPSASPTTHSQVADPAAPPARVPSAQGHHRLALKQVRCVLCRVDHWVFDTVDERDSAQSAHHPHGNALAQTTIQPPAAPPICPVCQRGRARQPGRVVQHDNGDN